MFRINGPFDRFEVKQGETLALVFLNYGTRDVGCGLESLPAITTALMELKDKKGGLFMSRSLASGNIGVFQDFGLITVEASSTETAALPLGEYLADLRLGTPSGDVMFSDTILIKIVNAVSDL